MSAQDWQQREQSRLDAMRMSDTAALQQLLDEAFVYFHASGARDTKASYLHKLSTGALRYVTLNFSELSGHELDDVCVVSGRMTAAVERSGQQARLDTRFSAIWLYRNSHWSLLALNSIHAVLSDSLP